jgi:hypothetical protein
MDSNVMNSLDACPKTCGSTTNVGNHTTGFFTEPADCSANRFGQVYNTKSYDSRDLSQTQIIYNFSRMLLQ